MLFRLSCIIILCFTISSCSSGNAPSVDGTTASQEARDELKTAIVASSSSDPVYSLSTDETTQLKELGTISESDMAIINEYLTSKQ